MQYFAACKTAATIVKQSKEKLWEEFGQKLDTDYSLANKLFWKTIHCLHSKRTPVATFIKDTNGVLLKHQKGILNCWREYFCELLIQYLETSDKEIVEEIGEKIHLTKADVSTAIKSLKAGKAFGEDNIQPEMLKAMNNF